MNKQLYMVDAGAGTYRPVTDALDTQTDMDVATEVTVVDDFTLTFECVQYYGHGGRLEMTVTRNLDEAMRLWIALMREDTEIGEPQ